MTQALYSSLCELKGANIANTIHQFLVKEQEPLPDDNDVVEMLYEHYPAAANELVCFMNKELIGRLITHLQSRCIGISGTLLTYEIHEDLNEPSNSYFTVTFSNHVYKNPTLEELTLIGEEIDACSHEVSTL